MYLALGYVENNIIILFRYLKLHEEIFDQTHFKTRNTISAHLIQSHVQVYTVNSLTLVFTTVDRALKSHPHQLKLDSYL